MAFKLENGNVALALYFSSRVLATEQFSIIKDKRHRTVHSGKKEPMIASLPVCHLSTKSSPPDLSCVLSELIMSSIKKKKKKNPRKNPTVLICSTFSKDKRDLILIQMNRKLMPRYAFCCMQFCSQHKEHTVAFSFFFFFFFVPLLLRGEKMCLLVLPGRGGQE